MPGTSTRASPAFRAAFGGLPRHGLAALLEAARPRTLHRGAYLFRVGEAAPCLFVVERGSVKLAVLDADGHETLLGVAAAGQVVGELTGGPQAFDARAGEPTHALALSVDRVRTILAACGVERRLLEIQIERTHDLARALHHVTRPDTRRRIAARVFDLTERHGRDVPEGRRLDIALTQEDIGRLTGTSRETANKVVAHLGRRGWLTRRDGRYVITDPVALSAFASAYPSFDGPSDSSQSHT